MLRVDVAKLSRADLERYLRPLLAPSGDDPAALRTHLEELANANLLFSSLVHVWGPEVYRRDHVLFRPLILSRFSFSYLDGSKFKRVPWDAKLEAWLAEVEAARDIQLASQLINWKLADRSGRWAPKPEVWRAELLRRFDAARDRAARQAELEKLSFQTYGLDEATARHIYEVDPEASRKFVLDRARWFSWFKTEFWDGLIEFARTRGDGEFAQQLYRQQVSPKRWQKDAVALCSRVPEPQALIDELQRIHPANAHDLGAGMVAILEKRGADVVPFVMKHLRNVYTGWMGRGEYGKIARLAAANNWWDLWAGAVRTCASGKEFNQELAELLGNRTADEAIVRQRLESLSGVSREWNFPGFGLARIHNLEEDNALALYDRFPDLLRGPFKVHLHDRYSSARRTRLIERLIAGGPADEELVDFLSSRYATNRMFGQPRQIAPEVEQLADYYLALRDTAGFARRAAAVLGQIPAYAVYDYPGLIRENRLARLLFERSLASYLNDERAVADLVEASEIHVMALAYRMLSLDDKRARRLAVHHLPLLLGTLLRPMHRATRMAAFGALGNAAAASEDAARQVLAKAREALVLPDRKYPKEELVGLIGRVIHHWPALRGPREASVVYRRSPAA